METPRPAPSATLLVPGLGLALGLALAACEQNTVPRATAAMDLASTSPPGDAASGSPSDGPGNGTTDGPPADLMQASMPRGFLAPCNANSDCASMLCHSFPGAGGDFCTLPCTKDSECPAPSPGCNPQGVCRIH
jgi:hypothetical protein